MKHHSPYYGYELSKGEIKTILQCFEELKEYRRIGTVKRFKYLSQSEHNYDNCHNLTCRTKCDKDGYNKAIEEFSEGLKRKYPIVGSVNRWLNENIDEIAKKMKRK